MGYESSVYINSARSDLRLTKVKLKTSTDAGLITPKTLWNNTECSTAYHVEGKPDKHMNTCEGLYRQLQHIRPTPEYILHQKTLDRLCK
jgi:hypothetical protein